METKYTKKELEFIKEIAYNIYKFRLNHGISGNAEDDWKLAEEHYEKKFKRIFMDNG
jgi:hypothetical protein